MDLFSTREEFKIPFVDLRALYKTLEPELTQAVARVLKRQWFLFGPELAGLEKKWSRYTKAAYCVGVASGTDALRLSFLTMGLEPDDQVVLPANTFIATFMAVVGVGATPVLCDVDRETQNMSLQCLRKVVTSKTKVIVPVHLFGNPCPMGELVSFAKERNILVVEDCCQAHGARLHGQHVGTFGHFGEFSFYPGKNLGAWGDGGAIVCGTKRRFESLLKLRNYGFRKKNYAAVYGENSRLDEIQSAVLSEKMQWLNKWNRIRERNASLYKKFLAKDIKSVRTLPRARSAHHAFVVRLKNRERVLRALRKKGVEAMIHYPRPIHKQPIYAKVTGRKDCFPVAEKLSKEILSLPVDIHMNEQSIRQVADLVNLHV